MLDLAFTQFLFPLIALISPLWARYLNGWAKYHLGLVFVENLWWKTLIDDLKSFVPNPATLPPVLLEAFQMDTDESYRISTTVSIKSVYDSIQINANDILRGTFYNTDSVLNRTYEYDVDDKGDYTIQGFAYKDGIQYPSNTLDIAVNPILEPVTEFSTIFFPTIHWIFSEYFFNDFITVLSFS